MKYQTLTARLLNSWGHQGSDPRYTAYDAMLN